MTTHFAGCQLTAKDFKICSGMLKRLTGTGTPLVPLLQEKIETGAVVAPEHMDPLVVTLNSRVLFDVDDSAPEMRIIVQSEFRHGLVGLTLPITTMRGLALLGLRQGQRRLFQEGGCTRRLFVRRLLYQPEARCFMPDTIHQHESPAKIIDLDCARDARSGHGDTSPMSS